MLYSELPKLGPIEAFQGIADALAAGYSELPKLGPIEATGNQ